VAHLIALDASVLIAFLDGGDAQHQRAEDTLISHAEQRFCASVLTVAEVLVGPASSGREQHVRDQLGRLDVDVVSLTDGDELRLARMRASTSLKLPDCCVLLAADARSAAVLSFDDRLRRAAIEHGLELADG